MNLAANDVLFWLCNAVVWLGFIGRGSILWNAAFREIIEKRRRSEFSVWLHPEAFTTHGQILRKKAIRFWIVGAVVVLMYFWLIVPFLGDRLR